MNGESHARTEARPFEAVQYYLLLCIQNPEYSEYSTCTEYAAHICVCIVKAESTGMHTVPGSTVLYFRRLSTFLKLMNRPVFQESRMVQEIRFMIKVWMQETKMLLENS